MWSCGRAGGEGTWIATLRAGKTWALELGRREGSSETAGGGGCNGKGGAGKVEPRSSGLGEEKPQLTA